MYPIITRFLLESVHRTTYKCLSSYPLIKKCIIQFDLTTPCKKVSSLCIPPTFQYEILVKLSLIINQRSLNKFVQKFVRILTSRHWGRLSNIYHIAGKDVTGQYRQLEFSMWPNFILCSSQYQKLMTSSPNFHNLVGSGRGYQTASLGARSVINTQKC